MTLSYENQFNAELLSNLEEFGHNTTTYEGECGPVVCAVEKLGNVVTAVADFRKPGQVAGF